MYSSTMIAPFGIISTLSFNNSLFGRNPTHKITKSASYSPFGVVTDLTEPFSSALKEVTAWFNANLIPRSSKVLSNTSVNSGSRYLLRIRSNPSINVTSLPDCSKASTNSIPMYPPPTITTFLAVWFCLMTSSAWL